MCVDMNRPSIRHHPRVDVICKYWPYVPTTLAGTTIAYIYIYTYKPKRRHAHAEPMRQCKQPLVQVQAGAL